MGIALKEWWQSDEYKAQIEEEARMENAREGNLWKIRDYQNGHVTFYDGNGDVTAEKL